MWTFKIFMILTIYIIGNSNAANYYANHHSDHKNSPAQHHAAFLSCFTNLSNAVSCSSLTLRTLRP